MKHDPLTQYISLRDALVREKANLEQRLREISAALGSDQGGAGTAAATSAPTTQSGAGYGSGRGGRRGNAMSLREAVVAALSERPLSRREIIDAVQRAGYRFASKDPLNSLGMVLYGKNPRFINVDGRYVIEGRPPAHSVPQPIAYQPQQGFQATPSQSYAPRKMSNSAREKLRAIAKARWARAKAQGRTAL